MASAKGIPPVHVPPDDPPPGGLEPAYSKEGVDLTQIRWRLRLTPTERLQILQDHIDFVAGLRQDRDPLEAR